MQYYTSTEVYANNAWKDKFAIDKQLHLKAEQEQYISLAPMQYYTSMEVYADIAQKNKFATDRQLHLQVEQDNTFHWQYDISQMNHYFLMLTFFRV